MQDPWDKWVPGVLNRIQMEDLCDRELFVLNAPFDEKYLDESSIELHLTEKAFQMRKGSVKPSGTMPYSYFLKQPHLAVEFSPDVNGIFTLRSRETYVFKLRERLGKPLAELGFFGQATAKSSVGRVDVLARLIVNGMDTYECFAPKCFEFGCGEMYLEITPITFDVLVKPGISLSQLRLFYGDPRNVEVEGKELFRTVYSGIKKNDGSLTVDISNTEIGGLPAAAFYVKVKNEKIEKGLPPISLWTEKGEEYGTALPITYWKLKSADEYSRLEIQSEEFYILRSKENICVPPGIAVYCRASDETIGEMRIHYAGFVHPWWGMRRVQGRGTPLIFEVRGHQVNVSLADGERMANLTFYRMSEDAPEPKPSRYEDQILKLSKFFQPWPDKLKWSEGVEDGTVEAF
jgi:dCTP deaminase